MSCSSSFVRPEERNPPPPDTSQNKARVERSNSEDLPPPITPRAVVLSHEDSDLNDLFEGEPDSDLFALSSPNYSNVMSTWLAFQDRQARDTTLDKYEQCAFVDTEGLQMASGGLGEGDIPYHDSQCKQWRESSVVDSHELEDSEVVRLSTFRMSGIGWSQPDPPVGNAYNQAYLASLRSDALHEYRDASAVHDYDAYSATGSSESISVFDEDTPFALNDEYTRDSTLKIPSAQTCVADSTRTSSVDFSSNKLPYSEKHDGFHFGFSMSENTQSVFGQSKLYLSEVTPADTQEHHPSIIVRSSPSSVSRASSLARELLNEEGLESSLAASHQQDDGLFSTKSIAATGSASPVRLDSEAPKALPPGAVSKNPHVSQVASAKLDDMNLSEQPDDAALLLRQFDVKPPLITEPGIPAFLSVDCSQSTRSDDFSCIAPPGLSDSSFQYNSARLTPPLRSLHASEQDFAQGTASFPPTKTKGFIRERSKVDRNMEQDDLDTRIQHFAPNAGAVTPVLTVISESESAPDVPPEDQQSRQGIVPVVRQSDPDSGASSVQSLDVQASATKDVSMSSPYSPPPAVPAHLLKNSPLSSPLDGLQNAFHVAQRGSRKATVARKGIVDPVSTRGRAISASPSKRKGTAPNKSILGAGVQGDTAKVAKSRTTRSARSVSRKSTTILKSRYDAEDGVPLMPKVPDDMDLNLPEMRLKVDNLPKDEQVVENLITADDERALKAEGAPVNITVTAEIDPSGVRNSSQPSQPRSHKPGSSARILGSKLHVPKTRISVRLGFTATVKKTGTTLDEQHSLTAEVTSTEHDDGVSQVSTTKHETGTSTPAPKKKHSARAITPYRVQKLILRGPRTPNTIPSVSNTTTPDLSNLISLPDFLPFNVVTHLPDSPTPTPVPTPTPKLKVKVEPKPRRTLRKDTPPPKRRKSTGGGTSKVKDHASVDEIPPVPPIPKTPDRVVSQGPFAAATNEQGGKLTPQSAERRSVGPQSASPLPVTLRRSPRLSGKRPGRGL